MASDTLYYHGQTREAIHEIASSPDASGPGVPVLPAVVGANIYVTGFAFHNMAGAARLFWLVEDTLGVGLAISIPIAVGNTETLVTNFAVPLAVNVPEADVGVLVNGPGQIEVEVWGYYTT